MHSTIVIGAAGRGTRMGELAADKPKHLVRVSGKPWLFFVLHAARLAGFERIIVIIGYQAHIMREFLRTLPFPVEIVDQQEHVGDKYGTAAVVESARAAVGEQSFVFQNGDCLFSQNILQQMRMNTNGHHALVGIHHPNARQYGVVETNADGLLLRIREKPEHPTTDVINAGLYAFQPTIFPAVQRVQISARGEYELTDAVNMLAAEDRVNVLMTTEPVAHLTAPEDISQLETVLRQLYPALASL